jgi:hypothetical protein
MEDVTFGVEIEILARPRVEYPAIRRAFEKANWDFSRSLDKKTHRLNSKIFEEFIVESLCRRDIAAHCERRNYNKWIVGRDGSIVEPKEEDGFKEYCNVYTSKLLIRCSHD